MLSLFSLIGRQASYALPIGLVIGFAFPAIAAALKPFLIPAFAIPLALSITRIEWSAQVRALKRWQMMTLVSFWILIIAPVVVWLVASPFDLPEPLFIALVLAAAAPPITACGALALFMRLDGATALVGTTLTLFLSPFTIPPLALYLLGLEIEISLFAFMARLGGLVFLSFAAAFLLKKLMGSERIKANASAIDGIAVLFISIFIIGIMDGMNALFFEQPEFVLLVLAASMALVFGLNILGALLFWRLGAQNALAVGLISGQANFGLLYMVLADQLPLEGLALFAIGQIPLYILPAIESPIAKWLTGRKPAE